MAPLSASVCNIHALGIRTSITNWVSTTSDPIHLHIHDHSYFDTIYASGPTHKRDKCSWWHHVGSTTMAGTMLEAMPHELHKTRRAAISNFFSKRSVQALEPLIVDSVSTLVQRLKTETGTGIVNLVDAYAAMTMDIICAYCFGTNMNSLANPAYGKEWVDTLHEGIQMRTLGRQFPRFVNTLFDIPPHIVAKFNAGMARSNAWTRQMLPRIEAILAGEDADTTHRTIFHEMRDGELSAEEKAPLRLMAEGHVLLGAGTETTARTLAVTTFYIIQNKDVGRKLREELRTVMPSPDTPVTLAQLEALPYLVRLLFSFLEFTSTDCHSPQ
jgi:cytochrome P450